jgi:hypothetical protein
MVRRSIGNTIQLIGIRNARRQSQEIDVCNVDHFELPRQQVTIESLADFIVQQNLLIFVSVFEKQKDRPWLFGSPPCYDAGLLSFGISLKP